MLASRSQKSARSAVQFQHPTNIRTPTISIVDPRVDDYHDWQILAHTHGARLQFFESAEAALRFSRGHVSDLWVVNANLPGLSGFELTSMLKARSAHTTVYLVADEYDSNAERNAWCSRATCFGYKPAHSEWLKQWFERPTTIASRPATILHPSI